MTTDRHQMKDKKEIRFKENKMPNPDDLELYRKLQEDTLRPEDMQAINERKAELEKIAQQLMEPVKGYRSERKPILCLDFDGVCHSYTSGWKGADIIPDPPVDGLFDFLLAAEEVFEIHVFSTRSLQDGGIQAMAEWFEDWREKLDKPYFKPLHFPTEKPPALVSIDDRAITFTGVWPDIDFLRNFKPWNKA